MFESSDKLDPKRALIFASVVGAFMVGWYTKGKWVVFRAEPHYTERIVECLGRADAAQLERGYNEAYLNRSKWNNDFAKLHWILLRAGEDRLDIEAIVRKAVTSEGSTVPESIRELTIQRIVESHEVAKGKYGLYKTVLNRTKLINGNRPIISMGAYEGRQCEADHIIPSSVVPQIAQLAVNLAWLSEPENVKKGDGVTSQGIELLNYLFEAKIISPETVKANLKAMKSQSTADEWRAAIRSGYPAN